METRRTFSWRRIKSCCFPVSSFQFGKASIELVIVHLVHDTEHVLHDHHVLEHLQVTGQRIERLLLVGELVFVLMLFTDLDWFDGDNRAAQVLGQRRRVREVWVRLRL